MPLDQEGEGSAGEVLRASWRRSVEKRNADVAISDGGGVCTSGV